jgi:acyl carrier protein
MKDWLSGESIDFSSFYQSGGFKRISLPTYPFEKKEFKLEKFVNSKVKEERLYVKSSKIEDLLKVEWHRILGVENLKNEEDFFELGGDSFLAIDILLFIEKEFGVKFELNDLLIYRTIKAQSEAVMDNITSKRKSVCIEFQKNGAKVPIVFVHPIGGTLFCLWWTPKPVPLNKMLFFSRRGEKNGKCTKELHGSGEGKNRARSVKRKFNTNTTNLKIWCSRHASIHLEKSIIKGSA